MEKKRYSIARTLAECAAMVALSVILSLLRLVSLPYGGAITMAGKLPLVVIGYRHGLKWGLISSFVYGAIELVLGLNTLSYVTGVASVVAVILLDYIFAFGVIGLSALTRKIQKQHISLMLGSLIACTARYICHVISGATVWAGLSIPTAAALTYSFIYNATYMLPETIILLIVSYFLGLSIDLSTDRPRPITKSTSNTPKIVFVFKTIALSLTTIALVIDTAAVFANLQNPESGEFDITGIANVNLLLVLIPTAIAICSIIAFVIVYFTNKKPKADESLDNEK